MAKGIRVRTKIDASGVADIKTLVKHVMETGNRKDEATGALVAAHYILQFNCTLNGETVMTANWGTAVSKNPYFSFKVSGATAGDALRFSWVDNLGQSDSLDYVLK